VFPGASFGLLIVAVLLLVILVPGLRYRRWRYEVTEDEVDLQEGVMIVRRTLVPMTRVQHVDTSQGPLDRAFGLANVTVATAAGAHKIPALTLEDADVLRDRISQLARVAVDDV
jgi:membrane protein YdbS with pleckstrin-like domain